MLQYDFLIIGGGITADAAITGIQSIKPAASIGIINTEKYHPYDRPPLSKGLWTKKMKLQEIFHPIQNENVSYHLSKTVIQIIPTKNKVRDDSGQEYGYGKLLIATGGSPRRLNDDCADLIYYRTIDDYKYILNQCRQRKDFCVIGGGFIGAEIAAALAMNHRKVTMIFPEIGVCGLLFPPKIAKFLNNYYQERGVEIISGRKVTRVVKIQDQISVFTDDKKERTFGCVVAGLGIIPNDQFAQKAGLLVNNGIVVNQFCQTSHPDIYAAGDVANFHCYSLDKQLRFEHEDNAKEMGKIAGKNIAGVFESYQHLPSFYSDLFQIGYEAVGDLNPNLTTVVDWVEKYKEGVVYYLENKRIRGILLWNIWEQLETARTLINEKTVSNLSDLKDLTKMFYSEIAH
jgi:NADPH-dependent 2,4-dienoyl-CoA reductase/sulfur reductase-like enzyme